MLIRLDLADGVVPALSERHIAALDNIGLSAFCGYHLVIGSRATLKALAEEPRLSLRAKAAYRAVLNRAAELGSIQRAIRSRIDVSVEAIEVSLNGGVWSVPLTYFAEPFVLAPPEILCENLTDAKFYYELGRWYGWHSRLRALSFFALPRGAGGSAIADELRERVAQGQPFTLCIVDSDRKYPGGPVGDTARRARERLPSDLWFIRLLILDLREVENLLPHAWLTKTQSGSQNAVVCEHRHAVQSRQLIFLAGYVDVKSGYSACQLLKSRIAGVRECARRELSELASEAVSLKDCLAADECAHDVPCFAVAGLGEALMNQVVKFLESAPSVQTKEVIGNERLKSLALRVFEWGVAAQKFRA